jgi:kynureninase
MAAHKASLEIFAAAGMEKLFSKAKQLSDYLFFILNDINNKLPQPLINVITPVNEKGCQASMQINEHGKSVHNALTNHGIITDWREPNVIRVAPVPLYNSFTDIFNFGEVLYHVLMELNKNSNSH